MLLPKYIDLSYFWSRLAVFAFNRAQGSALPLDVANKGLYLVEFADHEKEIGEVLRFEKRKGEVMMLIKRPSGDNRWLALGRWFADYSGEPSNPYLNLIEAAKYPGVLVSRHKEAQVLRNIANALVSQGLELQSVPYQ
jgi:hypothetical protein